MSVRDLVGPGCDDQTPLNRLVNNTSLNKNQDIDEFQQFSRLSLQDQEDDFSKPEPFLNLAYEREFYDEFYDPFEWNGSSLQMPSQFTEQQADYVFAPENPFDRVENPFSEGMNLYRQGNLHDAILAFESHIQRYPHNDAISSDAWKWLGTAHAENDLDKFAIICHQNAVKADPQNLEALLELGVSYANELNPSGSLSHLRSWLLQHPEYQSIAEYMPSQENLNRYDELHNAVSMFKKAAELGDDPDIHTVLGVLYNLTHEYDLAEKEFSLALKGDPSSHSIWNKIGATKANSPKLTGSKEAISAYRKALELKPNYVRAWVNMGISYSNQGKYDLSSKYYLKALSLNPKADHLWNYLRTSLTNANMPELAQKVDGHDLNLFRPFFKF